MSQGNARRSDRDVPSEHASPATSRGGLAAIVRLDDATFFSGLPVEAMQALADRGVTKVFPKGAVMIRQGDIGETMHVILDGRARVQREHPTLDGPVLLADLGPGEVVGEMGLLDHQPRSATVLALEETHTVEFTADEVTDVMLRFPAVASALLRTLSERIRSTNDLMDQARFGASRKVS